MNDWLPKMKEIEALFHGILLTLPSPTKPLLEEDYIARLINKTIGYYVRLT